MDQSKTKAMLASIRAGLQRYAETTDPYLIDHTVQVTSFGGSGTTALCNKFLDAGVDLQKGPAQWPFKHRRVPPTVDEVPDGFRVVYVVGDPRDAVVSIFRRNLQLGHYESLHDGRLPDEEVERRLASLEAFLAAGVDDFELADHLARWEGHPPGYPVMFLRYDHLAEGWQELHEFVGLPPGTAPLEVRARRSDWTGLPAEMRDALDRMYGDLARHIATQPPVRVV